MISIQFVCTADTWDPEGKVTAQTADQNDVVKQHVIFCICLHHIASIWGQHTPMKYAHSKVPPITQVMCNNMPIIRIANT